MGPFQEYEEKKSPQKGSPRSRIPRLILHPFHPKGANSPFSDSPYSEEDGKEYDVSSDHSKRTISSNSFYSDDTGCPTSQSVSPSKTPSGSDESTYRSPTLPERKVRVKRVRVIGETSHEPQSAPRQKKKLRSAMKVRGSEANFSSSSSTGSFKNKERITKLSGKKTPCHSLPPVFKPAGSHSTNRDAELYAPYRTPPGVAFSSSSSNSSPTSSRRANLSRYHSCSDNHGIKPPQPEQYLTPLQQKEVTIRHLKTKLLESDNRVYDREAEIEDLKGQLSRMREDWIEEECHRVEAQLSLKEARKEIKQLRQVVETMKTTLMEKDKGIQKYFIDINIQNRKLESLLQSMELAQSGVSLQDENTQDFFFESPKSGRKKMAGVEEGAMDLGDHGVEALADSGLLIDDEMANRSDILEQVLMSTAGEFNLDTLDKVNPGMDMGPGVSIISEISNPQPLVIKAPASRHISHSLKKKDKGTQTETMSMSQELQALLYQLLRLEGHRGPTLSVSSALVDLPKLPTFTCMHSPYLMAPISPYMLPPAPLDSTVLATDADFGCSDLAEIPMMDELDFEPSTEKQLLSLEMSAFNQRYWSNSFLVDLVAIAAPVLPTLVWLYSQHGVDKSTPVNIATLIRGCCIMGLYSLRRIAPKPDL
ncbi:syntabulin isoform X1 [Stigmatopora nigra]